ncbi:ShlB/FhaC/HecB family hemolysin secretion/activation protein [Caulobacter sp. UNC358MFTsu5.1]|uniref:ShlB/FhaC/HecB family hemolysin secretion/activation protein n=1 Tax=Caulobacter sp. UNC358MFTsu5.1 TaxID=1449049 RepID=UPI0018CC74D6|nr:ShlB/FhaC/HecB family hemolysin secretion/activation protein [Caulobacter sp. UNC358MFTsu5.1]
MKPHSKSPARWAAMIVALAASAPLVARAQDFERVIPRPPQPATPPPVQPPPPASPPSQDRTVLLPRLEGLVFVPDPGSVQPAGVAPPPTGLATADLPLLSTPAFTRQATDYLGKPLTRADLDKITALVRAAYRKAGRPFMDVTAPPQNIQNGVVQIVVTEFRVGEVTIAGNRHFSSETVRRLGGLDSGEPLTLARMRGALDGYNQNAFLTVDAVLRPGAETGLSDVALTAHDRFPFRVYAGYDNQGVTTLGRDEWNVGFNWGNVFGRGGTFSYQFTQSFSGRYTSHSFSDVVPLVDGDRLLFFGAYAIQKPRVAREFGSKGHSGQFSGRWAHPVIGPGPIKQTLQIGFDYKRVDNTLEFLGFRLLDTDVEIVQFPVIYSLTATDRAGQTDLENLAVLSPGELAPHNGDREMRLLVPGGDATYAYDRFSATRTTTLPKGFTWIARGVAQIASGNLPYSEQLAAGGIGSVRGYDTNIALGSNGVILSTEMRFPTIRVGQALGRPGLDDRLQLGVFVDYGKFEQPTDFPDLADEAELASLGFNLRYVVDRHFALQLEFGSQLKPAPGQAHKASQFAVSTSIGF